MATGAIISSVITSGAMGVLLKMWLGHQFEKRLAEHSAEINHKNELASAAFKHKLELAAAERNFRFSHVFERTAETIATTYKLLLELHAAVMNFTAAVEVEDTSRAVARQVMEDKVKAFFGYYPSNKIYIPRKTAEKIRVFSNTLDKLTSKTIMLAQAERAKLSTGQMIEWYKKLDALRDEIPSLLTSLEIEFQEILGFPPEEK